MSNNIFWLTGNTGAGKSTVAFAAKEALGALGHANVIVLDGDELRASISTHEDLSAAGRRSHNLRVARLAALLSGQGHIVIVCVIAPFQAVRQEVAAICDPTWVHVKRSGLEADDRPYEPPVDPALVLDHDTLDEIQSTEQFVALICAQCQLG